ncbi:MAG: cysteine desulfurase NifS, partial [Planctomycetes bacterium]|nr:cysteine desulfurase NifS [Planctomycetota bacterium]
IMCSSGSACLAAADGPSQVLEAMDVPGDYIHGAVRISLGLETNQADIDRAMLALTRSVDHLRRIDL